MAEKEPDKKRLLEKTLDKMLGGVKGWWEDLRIGDGHAAGMGRLGVAEIRQAFSYGSGSIEQPTPYGIYGTLTPGEVAADRKDSAAAGMDEEPALGNQFMAEGVSSRDTMKSLFGEMQQDYELAKQRDRTPRQNEGMER